ncbi:tyrosine-type recombinase/integrase [Bdellovibrio bacteriovorus]|uniref:tyrosine-type recombinase/integrase n=1 Tax=Bdellovibrio bacteriovorus TaxID=959 RepID=UPI0021CF1066|nr:tyrosine-type recombinase/integrase [Bdellovibrio bacteriovorus]UXR66100.1 tyrosine-type recombinase/integrase [Bdellovibrio bacteriovorus]
MALKTTQKRRGSHVEIAPPPLHLLKELKIKSADSVFVLPRIDDWDAGRQAEILRTFLFGINLPRIRFHDLRASWATLCLSRGIESVKVMSMGGWKDLKTMMVYVRKAGINIQGMTDSLNFHDTAQNTGKILKLKQTAED